MNTSYGRLDTSGFTREEMAIIDKISRDGELDAMDRVEIVGLKTEKGKELNGRIGTVKAISGDNDGRVNPYRAQLPDGRYRIDIEFEETRGEEIRPGIYKFSGETKTFSLKRENLKIHEVSMGTLARDPQGMAMLRRRGINIFSTAEREAAEPETKGFFPAVLQGDVTRTREILEHIKNQGCPDPANQILDAKGDMALIGGIEKGHPGIVKLLLEYGGNPNDKCNMPILREENITYFLLSLLMFDRLDNAEEIVNALIDGGGDVNVMSPRGTPLSSAVKISSDHEARMRILRKLLDHGADPNQLIEVPSTNDQGNSLTTACVSELGIYSESDRLEVVQLLVDAGADPGMMLTTSSRGETCNAIHCAVSHRKADILRVLLACEKGRAAVNVRRTERCQYPGENNGHMETAITMACGQDGLDKYRANRDMAVQLLNAGANPNIKDHVGLSAMMWLRDGTPKKKQLHILVKKAQKHGSQIWDSDEARAFVEEGQNDLEQCDNCGIWSDEQYSNGQHHTGFQRCARCKRVYYCSRECQKKRWKHHKKVCKAP